MYGSQPWCSDWRYPTTLIAREGAFLGDLNILWAVCWITFTVSVKRVSNAVKDDVLAFRAQLREVENIVR